MNTNDQHQMWTAAGRLGATRGLSAGQVIELALDAVVRHDTQARAELEAMRSTAFGAPARPVRRSRTIARRPSPARSAPPAASPSTGPVDARTQRILRVTRRTPR